MDEDRKILRTNKSAGGAVKGNEAKNGGKNIRRRGERQEILSANSRCIAANWGGGRGCGDYGTTDYRTSDLGNGVGRELRDIAFKTPQNGGPALACTAFVWPICHVVLALTSLAIRIAQESLGQR